MSNKFKAGDKVRCINSDGYYSKIKIGRAYVIDRCEGWGVKIVGLDVLMEHYQFELISSKGRKNNE